MQLSNKMVTFLSLLALSVLAGDKVLVFSQSLYTLDVIEQFLKMTSWAQDLLPPSEDNAVNHKKFSNWYHGKDYLRIDGKTKDRQALIDRFNDPKRGAFKLFMVCTKAGNMGINLYTANRVVIFDSSWNPVHDLQAISRAYRYGQQKEVFVYRLVAGGSMEEVIYKRQMLKQALAARVVDAQMPDNQSDGGGLMDFDRENEKEEAGGGSSSSTGGLVLSETVHEDAVLMQFVERHASRLSYIADQEVLLADKEESHLNAEEQVAAEAEYDKEVKREAYIAQLTQQAQASQLQAINAHRATMGLPPLPVTAPVAAPVAPEDSYEESQTFNGEQAADEAAVGSSGSSGGN
jgi:transcriptional regulator ATRX